jgi:hypothetical protein
LKFILRARITEMKSTKFRLNKRILILLLFLVIFSIAGFCQSLAEDILRVNSAYQNHAKYSMILEYYLIQSNDTVKTRIANPGFLLKFDDILYTKISNNESFYNDSLSIYVNTEEKKVTIGNPIKLKVKGIGLPDIDSLINVGGTFTLISEDTKEKVYLMTPKTNVFVPFSSIELHISKTNYFYSKLVIWSKSRSANSQEQTGFVVDFKNIDLDPDIKAANLKLEAYITNSNNGKPALAGKYKDYKLIDLRVNK